MRSVTLLAPTLAVALAVAAWVGSPARPAPAAAEGPSRPGAPPFDLADDHAIDEGARLFRASCTGYCHGKDGGASRAPKLRGQKLEGNYVYARIAKGSPNGMPAFESALSRDDIWKLVAYVLSLARAEDQ